MVSVYYQNVRGLRTKTSEFCDNLLGSAYDLVCLTETWLNPEVHDSLLFSDDYQVFRSDRSPTIASRGGGTLIAVRNNAATRRRSDLETFFESTWIEVNVSGTPLTLLIGTIYIPPGTPLQSYVEFCDGLAIRLASYRGILLMLGDFNCSPSNTPNIHSHVFNTLCSELATLGLHQLNMHHNAHGKILDHIWAQTSSFLVLHSNCPLVREDAHHPALEFTLPCRLSLSTQNSLNWDFRCGNYTDLYASLAAIDWSALYTSTNVDEAVDIFYNSIMKCLHKCVPKRYFANRQHSQVWNSKHARTMAGMKRKYHRKFKRSGKLIRYQVFSHCRRLLKKQLAIDAKRTSTQLDGNHRLCHSWAKGHGIGHSENQYLTLSDFSDASPQDLANNFATQFAQVQNCTSTPVTASIQASCLPLLSPPIISEKDVERMITTIKPSKFSGPDDLPPFIVKGCAALISAPLAHIFMVSLASGHYPSVWKRALIMPLHKAGSRSNLMNYRPVSHLGVCAKIFDRLIAKHISSVYNNFIDQHQHGFVRGRSTETNLVCFLQAASDQVGHAGQLDTLYIDISKAFDTVPHQLILNQLDAMGCSPRLVNWFDSYLSNRYYTVYVAGSTSTPYTSVAGVPQGSVLGPMLFNIAINPLMATCKHSGVLAYADDIKLFRPVITSEDSALLQMDLNSISQWCRMNGLNINRDKTKFVSFTRKQRPTAATYQIDGIAIQKELTHRDLGVTFSTDLRFNRHVDLMYRTVCWQSGRILRATVRFVSPHIAIFLYRTYIVPILQYASCVWNGLPHYLVSKLERLPSRFARALAFRGHPLSEIKAGIGHPFVSMLHARNCRDVQFISRILTGAIMSPPLLELIFVRTTPHSSRAGSHLVTKNLESPIGRAITLLHNTDPNPDFWCSKKVPKLKTLAVNTPFSSL